MSQFIPPLLRSLHFQNKVIVLTGGSLGVGAQLTRLLAASGAHVYFGDILSEPGLELQNSIKEQTSPGSATFVQTDVTKYSDNVRLFDTAFHEHGHITHAISNAGISERGNLIDPALTLETARHEPKNLLTVSDVCFTGPLHFARLASVYLRQPPPAGHDQAKDDKTLTLVSSVAGFKESPGLNVYEPSKAGVLGLMKTLRKPLLAAPYGIRTNAICPWMTRTRLVSSRIEEAWDEAGLPSNSAAQVAGLMMGVLADEGLSGEAVYVEGGRGWLVEREIERLQPVWLGEKQSRELERGQQVLGNGEGWWPE